VGGVVIGGIGTEVVVGAGTGIVVGDGDDVGATDTEVVGGWSIIVYVVGGGNYGVVGSKHVVTVVLVSADFI